MIANAELSPELMESMNDVDWDAVDAAYTEQLDAIRDGSYNAGYGDGEADGYARGREEGVASGTAAGYARGYAVGAKSADIERLTAVPRGIRGADSDSS